MTGVNEAGYIARGRHISLQKKKPERDWWLIKCHPSKVLKDFDEGRVYLGIIHLPEKYIGKRVRLKVEILNEEVKQ